MQILFHSRRASYLSGIAVCAALCAGLAGSGAYAQNALPTPAPSAASDAMTPYVLTNDDQIDIIVQDHDELKASVIILPDGTFNYPIVGTVHAAGMTVAQLTRTLISGLSAEVNQPQVTVSVRQSRARSVSVLGAVTHPGLYDYKPGWRLLEALAAAGGPLQEAAMTQITVVQAATNKSIPIDDVKLMSGDSGADNAPLGPGDVVMVSQRDPATAQAQVIGEVNRPGLYSVPTDGATVLSLITQASGATPNAALTRVQIMHGGHVQTLDLRAMMNTLDSTASVRVVAGDVVLIPANSAKVAVLGAVTAPAPYLIPDGQHLTVSGALALAGGPTGEAVKRETRLARRGPDGQYTTTEIDLDKMLKGDSTIAGIEMHPGDILYVPAKGQNNALTTLGPLAAIGNLFRL